ncbi:rosmarinate synthase [Heracleum sosnowskyi]|uniref:Rosmarinate synthase n=1 Tax=Heracleum sosnowskyi TaxID=360622 RepID=A0AAD8MKD9_9APIA|nr:rosmarinate synthase [Heracleum sosnowskyi]
MAQISSICKRSVVSSEPVQSGKTCQLSVLDRVMEKNNVRIVLYNKNQVKKDGGETTRKLKESLAEVLSSFPIITGRLAKTPEGHWTINCNDAGVRIVEAKAEGNVEEWLRNVNRDKELLLVHWEVMLHKPYFWSTFYIQLTEFKQGGIAIGLSCSHLLADPICATMFLKAWAETTLGRTMTSPPFFHPLPPRRPANINQNRRHYYELINCYKNPIPSLPAPQHATSTITLEFSHQMVTACMTMHEGLTLTPFEALAALFWVAISKVKESKRGLIKMSICLDMRKVLGLDKGFFGNCMIYNKVDFASRLDHNELMVLEAGLAIKNVANKMDNEGIMDLVEWLESKNHQSPPMMSDHDLICVNLENVEAYNIMFDDEQNKPIRASYYVEPAVGEGKILILPSPESSKGSLNKVVMVTLPGDEAVKLCQEALLMKFCPTICMA